MAFTGDLSGVAWNCRSLWAYSESDTIKFVMDLLDSHDSVALTETRETKERLAFLNLSLPITCTVFSSGISQ